MVERFDFSIHIKDVVSKSINVLSPVRSKCLQGLFVNGMAFRNQLIKNPTHFIYIIKDQKISNQVIVFNDFVLLMSEIFWDDLTSKSNPIGKLVELLTFIGGCADGSSQLNIMDILKEELSPYGSA